MAPDVRIAGPADLDTLARLAVAFEGEFGNTVDPGLEARLAPLLEDEQATFLLVGEPAFGFAVVRLRAVYWTVAPDAVVDDLYVAPDRRGHGHGRALLRAAIAAAREQGAGHLELTTTEEDVAAAALYRAEGLRETEDAKPDSGRVIWFGLDL